MFTKEEMEALTLKLGNEAAKQAQVVVDAATKKVETALADTATKAEMQEAISAQKTAIEQLNGIALKQGIKLSEIVQGLDAGKGGRTYKSIDEMLFADREELAKIHQNRSGNKEYMVGVTPKGEFYMIHKAAGPNATIDGTASGATSTVTTQVSGSALLRAAAGAEINNLYTASPFIFNQLNLINTSFEKSQYSYWDETAPEGEAAIVAEGAMKPLRQNHFELKTASYKKVAVLLGFTEEFDLDFPAIRDNIIATTQTHVMSKIQDAIIADIIAKATAYSTASLFGTTTSPNEWDVMAAMAAQVEAQTEGIMANVALVGTYKKYKMGVLKAVNSGVWLNSPDIIKSIKLQSTQALNDNVDADIVVGDLRNYNVALRGGIIVRVGYNGTDFASNKFSVVVEQLYFNWISANRTKALVKGKFATIISALTAA